MPTENAHPFDNFFSPTSIAVVGVSATPRKIGHEIFRCISQSDFKGKVYPVGRAETILGVKCYQSISEIPDEIDLAIYALPPQIIPSLVEEAGRKGVKNVIIVSGGFKEMGEDGASYEQELLKVARRYGVRVIGPNCIGVFDGETRLDTFFYPPEKMRRPKEGRLSFVTQSGTFGVTFLEWASNSSLGIRRLISLGNKCDVDETEILRYLSSDPKTDVIALHLESIADGRQLIEVAREVSSRKPIVVYKSGRTEAGVKAAMSHTGSLAGAYDIAVSAFKQAGMIIAETLEELFDKSKAIVRQPPSQGNRIAIVTNCAGPSVSAADFAHEMGFTVNLSPETVTRLRNSLPAYANIGIYVDLTGSATSEDYKKSLDLVLKDPETDVIAVFIVFVNAAMTPDVVEVIAGALNRGKPVLCYATGGDYTSELIRRLEESGVSTYPTAQRLMNAIVGLVEAGQLKVSALPTVEVKADREAAAQIVKKITLKSREMLTEVESKDMLRAYGIKTTTERLATKPTEAAQFASEIGFPVVLKILSPDIVHKSDVGGVVTDIEDPSSASKVFSNIVSNVRENKPEARIQGVLVQNQLSGVEVFIGSILDKQFGPVMVFGLGGIFTEVLKDVSFGLAPLTEQDALRMINETKAGQLLAGMRGQPPADVKAVVDLMVRASFLAVEQHITEMDLNPVMASPSGCAVADARMRVRMP